MSSKGDEHRTLGSRIAIVLSSLALFAALAGGAWAAATITSKDIAKDAVKSKQIKAGAVKTDELAAGAVTSDKLGDGAVTATKIASGAVESGKLADGSVATAKLADGSVTTPKLADGAVATAKLGDAAVSTGKLADGAVTSAKAGAGVLRDMVIVEDREPDTGFTTGTSKQAFPTCPAGYVITGGGARILGDTDTTTLADETFVTDVPIAPGNGGLTQWFAQADDTLAGDNDDWALDATAVCVKA